MAEQHEGGGSLNSVANPAPSASSVRAAAIRNSELGDENDAEHISYTFYGGHNQALSVNVESSYDSDCGDYMEKKEHVYTILCKEISEVDHYLAELEKLGKLRTKTFTECLRSRLGPELNSQKDPGYVDDPRRVRVLYR